MPSYGQRQKKSRRALANRVINKGIEQVNIDLLKHHPRNANQGDVEAIKKSLAVNGWYGSVVANMSTKHILAGNHRVMAAKALGWETVPVQWVDVTPEEELRILVVDNRTTRIGQDDTTKITDILAELANTPIGLEGTGYGAADLDALIDELAGTADPAELLTDPDEVPEEVETRCKPGDLWILGRHRLLCGDSTSVDDVARLMDGAVAEMMFTDPPYGVNYEGGHFHSGDVNIKRKREKLADDDSTAIYTDFLPVALSAVDGPCYMWFAGSKARDVYNAVHDNECEVHTLIIWNKTNATYAAMNAQYKPRHEPCLYFKPKGSTLRWCGSTTEATVWDQARDGINEFHPTQKPIALASKAIGNHDAKTVLEMFGGSGSTLIACEQLGRKCYAMEISPKYCDVIIQRWENATGQKAVLDGR
jgi:DNA modification methylase